jgi:hypothetical protein
LVNGSYTIRHKPNVCVQQVVAAAKTMKTLPASVNDNMYRPRPSDGQPVTEALENAAPRSDKTATVIALKDVVA